MPPGVSPASISLGMALAHTVRAYQLSGPSQLASPPTLDTVLHHNPSPVLDGRNLRVVHYRATDAATWVSQQQYTAPVLTEDG